MNPISSSQEFILLALSLFVIALIITIVFGFRLGRILKNTGATVGQLGDELRGYRSYTAYLNGKKRLEAQKSLASLQNSINHSMKYGFLLSRARKTCIVSSVEQIDELRSFLETYMKDYANQTVKSYSEFFSRTSLDDQQLQAVVKDERHNLVVAAAGAGKTNLLTARMAFLLEMEVSPDRILALAYTQPAAREMQDRLAERYKLNGLNVRTFHSFGRELARLSPNFRNNVIDEGEPQKIVRDSLTRLSKEHDFAVSMLQFAIEYPNEDPEPADFADQNKYYEYVRNQRYTTLSSDTVKSVAERDIANFLFLNQIEFKYEDTATWADNSNRNYRAYKPDFHILHPDIWIEHRAIDRQGKVPEWFAYGDSNQSEDPSVRYWRRIGWSREQFARKNRRLVETFHYQWAEGTLIQYLRKTLQAYGVQLKELPTTELVKKVYNLLPRHDPLEDLIVSFINKAKSNGLNLTDVERRAATRILNRRQKAFLSLALPVWQEYETRLKSSNKIDFNDMINLALEVASSHQAELKDKYSHILIDEFQDITDTQVELIKNLMTGEDSHLFCVGDDWQNIFSFAGSNVYNILNFDRHFHESEKSYVETNYRCPKNIVEASNHTISMNRFQMKKNVTPKSTLNCPIVVEEMPRNLSSNGYEEWEINAAMNLIGQIIRRKTESEKILVLARYNDQLNKLALEFPESRKSNLDFLSIHRAKGKEAEYVLLLGCIDGEQGFPSEIKEEKLLEIVKGRSEEVESKLEEERRLFYVALTRCKKEMYIFTSNRARSTFLSEISPFIIPSAALLKPTRRIER